MINIFKNSDHETNVFEFEQRIRPAGNIHKSTQENGQTCMPITLGADPAHLVLDEFMGSPDVYTRLIPSKHRGRPSAHNHHERSRLKDFRSKQGTVDENERIGRRSKCATGGRVSQLIGFAHHKEACYDR